MGRTERTATFMIGFSFIGLIFAMMENYMYTHSILLDVIVSSSGLTMYVIEIVTVFIWLLIGIILSALD